MNKLHMILIEYIPHFKNAFYVGFTSINTRYTFFKLLVFCCKLFAESWCTVTERLRLLCWDLCICNNLNYELCMRSLRILTSSLCWTFNVNRLASKDPLLIFTWHEPYSIIIPSYQLFVFEIYLFMPNFSVFFFILQKKYW